MKNFARTMLALAAVVAIAAPAWAKPIPTTTTLNINPNPVAIGEDVTLTASVTATPAVDGGKLRIKQLFVSGVPASCAAWVAAAPGDRTESIVAEIDPLVGGAYQVQYLDADTSVLGSYGYSAQYVPSSGSGYAQSQSGCVNLVVVENDCPEELTITIFESTGSASAAPDSTYTGGFKVRVQKCGDPLSGITAQGGTSGWTNYTGHYADSPTSAAIRNANKRNEVLLWTIGALPNAGDTDKELNVWLNGYIKPKTADGTILFLSGEWSAQSGGVKTAYTDRVFIVVDDPAVP
jgi:hypothetical protein